MRDALERRLRTRLLEDGYLFPDYDGYCFANVPDTVRSLLGAGARRPLPADVLGDAGGAYDRVLVLLVDGFGLESWKRHDGHPLLERFEAGGTVSPLTSVYPSETAAALTTFHTGRLPAEHGVVGWNVYEPTLDAAFEAFTVRPKGGAAATDLDPADVYDGEALYPALRAGGIDCRHVVPFEETYDGAVAHTYEYEDATDAPRALSAAFEATTDPAYLFVYLPHVDHTAHERGTRSAAHRETVATVLDALERGLSALADGGRTLVVLTADHGHVDTDPARNVDLERFESVAANLKRHGCGDPVRFSGSPRNVHLHLRDGAVESVRDDLASALDARVYRREEALERSLFGDRAASDAFRRRAGDLIVTHRELSVWYGSEGDSLELVGMHGGLHPAEMLVPFAVAPLEALS